MTIRVTDTEAEKRYEKALEEYREKVDEKIAKPTPPPGWPKYPDPPKPMFDSNTERAGKDLNATPMGGAYGGMGPYSSPPLSECCVDYDGTATETPKGFETNWQESAGIALPFKLK